MKIISVIEDQDVVKKIPPKAGKPSRGGQVLNHGFYVDLSACGYPADHLPSLPLTHKAGIPYIPSQ